MSGKKKKGRKVGGGSSSPVQVSQKAVLGGKRLLKKQLGYTLAIQIAVLGTVSFVPEGLTVSQDILDGTQLQDEEDKEEEEQQQQA